MPVSLIKNFHSVATIEITNPNGFPRKPSPVEELKMWKQSSATSTPAMSGSLLSMTGGRGFGVTAVLTLCILVGLCVAATSLRSGAESGRRMVCKSHSWMPVNYDQWCTATCTADPASCSMLCSCTSYGPAKLTCTQKEDSPATAKWCDYTCNLLPNTCPDHLCDCQ
eukprot:GFYU01000333.1.p1 GENE.GFYU01000333.1~~GFYU01000333.1.p1  ORF type:complete len:167 (+),score=21.62 GFYU01000333.1:142-642(+)